MQRSATYGAHMLTQYVEEADEFEPHDVVRMTSLLHLALGVGITYAVVPCDADIPEHIRTLVRLD